jgi:hypothetical protein
VPDEQRDRPPRAMNDAEWNQAQRNETPTERLDRNWTELLQEFRVVQTGVQLLTGFLLTLPFQQRFAELTALQQNIYLVSVAAAVLSTGCLIAPVALHRLLFRRHARRVMVSAAQRLVIVGTALLGMSIIAVTLLIFDVVKGLGVGITAAVIAGVVVVGLWLITPLALRSKADLREQADDD